MRRVPLALVVVAVAATMTCGRGREISSPVAFTPGPTPAQTAVLVGAGDIGECIPTGAAELTANLLDRVEGTIFTAGDNSYPGGSMQDFRSCYELTWGRHKGRTRPAPGNHDYEVPGAADYFTYFGANAGPPGQGFYSYRAGNWLVLSLNSNIAVDRNSVQMAWVRNEVSLSTTPCALAYFHHSPFSSGGHGNHDYMRDLWRELYQGGVDVAVAAHDHLYERFSPMDNDGRLDPARGIRLFVAGTGGARLVGFSRSEVNSEVRMSAHGVLKLTLNQGGYQWEFLQVAGGIADTGVGTCH